MVFLRVKNSLKSIFICKGCVGGPVAIEADRLIDIPKSTVNVDLPVSITHYLKTDICELCTGLNQLIRTEAFLADLDRNIETSGYEYRSFNFNFRIPLSLKIRQAYLKEMVVKELVECEGELKSEDLSLAINADLKSQIKQFLNMRYAKKLNASVENSDDFAICVEFFNVKDEQDMVR